MLKALKALKARRHPAPAPAAPLPGSALRASDSEPQPLRFGFGWQTCAVRVYSRSPGGLDLSPLALPTRSRFPSGSKAPLTECGSPQPFHAGLQVGPSFFVWKRPLSFVQNRRLAPRGFGRILGSVPSQVFSLRLL